MLCIAIAIHTQRGHILHKNSIKYTSHSIILDGIDCPEMKAKTKTEKEMAILARDKLSKKILGEWVELRNVQQEKYGRVLAEVWHGSDRTSVNEWLVKNRLAVKYDGGKKETPKNWRRYYNSKQ